MSGDRTIQLIMWDSGNLEGLYVAFVLGEKGGIWVLSPMRKDVYLVTLFPEHRIMEDFLITFQDNKEIRVKVTTVCF